MRALALVSALVVVSTAVASAQAATRPGTQFDGTYHLRAPAFPAHLTIDCPAQNGVAAYHKSMPIPASAHNVHVLGGVYAGHHVEGSGTIGHIWINYKTAMAGGTATVTIAISFNSTFHQMSIAEHIMGKFGPTCSMTGGFVQSGNRIGP